MLPPSEVVTNFNAAGQSVPALRVGGFAFLRKRVVKTFTSRVLGNVTDATAVATVIWVRNSCRRHAEAAVGAERGHDV